MTDETREQSIAAVMTGVQQLVWGDDCGGIWTEEGGGNHDDCLCGEPCRDSADAIQAAITHALDREQERTLEAVLAGLRVCSCGASGVTVVNGQYETEYERCFIHRMLDEVRERMVDAEST